MTSSSKVRVATGDAAEERAADRTTGKCASPIELALSDQGGARVISIDGIGIIRIANRRCLDAGLDATAGSTDVCDVTWIE